MAKKPPKKEKRKGMGVRLIALVLVALLVVSAIVSALISLAYAQERDQTQTRLQMTIDENLEGVRLEQRTLYVNTAEKPLDQLLFAMPANLLRRLTSAPYADLDAAYPDGFAPSGADISQVLIDGEPARWGIQGAGEEFLRVDCALAPGESAECTFIYELALAHNSAFLGIDVGGWRMSGFYFAPMVYDSSLQTFVYENRSAVDRGGVGIRQDFAVSIDAPAELFIAAGGTIDRGQAENGRVTTQVSVSGARDFALILRKSNTVRESEESAVALRVYADRYADRVEAAAKRVLRGLTQLLGDFPFAALAIAQTDNSGESEAFSGMVWLDSELVQSGDADEIERALAFLIARQWFSQALGTNSVYEPWLNEAVPAYAALRYYEETYGYERFLDELNKNSLASLQVTMPGGLTVDAAKAYFASREEYLLILRGRGAAVLHELRGLMGKDAFDAAIRAYYAQNAIGLASIGDLAEAINLSSGRELDYFLMETLRTIDAYVSQRLEWYE